MAGHALAPLLLVESEQPLLGTIATWLHEEGHEIVTCSRYEDARRFLAGQTPAGLVADVRLGAYNGLQLAVLLRDRVADVPIILLSASMDPLLKDETERLGGVFLVAPIIRDALVAALTGAEPQAH